MVAGKVNRGTRTRGRTVNTDKDYYRNKFLESVYEGIVAEAVATRPAHMTMDRAFRILVVDRRERGILTVDEAVTLCGRWGKDGGR
jgi:hypothetical protein